MKKERCMLFFDIDGTLITTDGKRTFPESAKRALREARERGHLVYINTGRVMENVDDFIREVGFDGYVCGCGTYIVSEGEVMLHHRIPQERCREIAYKCRECHMMAIFEHTDHTGYDSALAGEDAGYQEITLKIRNFALTSLPAGMRKATRSCRNLLIICLKILPVFSVRAIS